MKRQNRVIVGLLAAGITFATLMATVGTEHWKRGYYHHHYGYHCYDEHYDKEGNRGEGNTLENEQKSPDSAR